MIPAEFDKLVAIQDDLDGFFNDAKQQKGAKMEVEKKNDTETTFGGARRALSTTLEGKIETEEKTLMFRLENNNPDTTRE